MAEWQSGTIRVEPSGDELPCEFRIHPDRAEARGLPRLPQLPISKFVYVDAEGDPVAEEWDSVDEDGAHQRRFRRF